MFSKTKSDLIVDGEFKASSGDTYPFKIECDALSDASIAAISVLIRNRFKFCEVYGIPTGGDRLAKALAPYVTKSAHEVLIVDDVISTGASFEEARKIYGTRPCIGIAIVSRMSKTPDWIQAVFQLWSHDATNVVQQTREVPYPVELVPEAEKLRLRIPNPAVDSVSETNTD